MSRIPDAENDAKDEKDPEQGKLHGGHEVLKQGTLLQGTEMNQRQGQDR